MANEIKMPGTPPDWVNGLLGVMLRTPLVQRLVGKTFALLTVTGAKTGRRYTLPVQYLRHGGEFVVLSQRKRKWWRNFKTRPEIEVRIEGVTMPGHARIASDVEARSVLGDCLRDDPKVARFYGMEPDDHGEFRSESLGQLLQRVVVIMVTTQPIDLELDPADVVIPGF